MRVLPCMINAEMKFKKFQTIILVQPRANNSSCQASIKALIPSMNRWICSLHLLTNLQMMCNLIIFIWSFQIQHLLKTSMISRPSVRPSVKKSPTLEGDNHQCLISLETPISTQMRKKTYQELIAWSLESSCLALILRGFCLRTNGVLSSINLIIRALGTITALGNFKSSAM